LFIVEGPDGAGKTTLVDRLEKELGFQRQARVVSSEAEAQVPLGPWTEAQINDGFGPKLYDRFALISAPMYMYLPNRTFTAQFTDRIWLTEMWRKFWMVDAAIVICLPPLEDVQKNVDGDASNLVVHDYIDEIYWSYHNWYCQQRSLYNTSVILWDYTQPNEKQLWGISQWAKARVETHETWRRRSWKIASA
jgi:hypothetical protein